MNNNKIIYIISASAMLVVAISIGFIFNSKVPSVPNVASYNADNLPQTNMAISITETLEPVQDLIAHETKDKPISKKDNENIKDITSPSMVENLTFSAEDVNTVEEKNKTAEIIDIIEKQQSKPPTKAKIQKPEIQIQKPDAKIQETEIKIQEPKTIPPLPIEKTIDKNKEVTIKKEVEPQKEAGKIQEIKEIKEIKETPKEARKKDVLVTKSHLQPKENTSTIFQATLTMDGDQVTLLIEGDKPIDARSFILAKPNRIVFDIKGTWAISIPRVISNRMVRAIRLGKTNTHTRLVFDLKVKPNSTKVEQLSSNKSQLIFR